MISQESAIDNARAIAKHNNFVWREDDIHVEWREAKTASKNWFKRRFFSDYAGHPACWLVRVGQPPTGDEWLDEGIDEFFMKPGGEGFGYLFDAETGEFIGVDVGFKVALKREISLKTPTRLSRTMISTLAEQQFAQGTNSTSTSRASTRPSWSITRN